MTIRRVLPLVVLGGTLAVLAVPLAIGSGEARVAAALVGASTIVLLAFAVHVARRDYAIDAPFLAIAADGLRGPWAWILGMTVAETAMVLAWMGPASGPRDDVGWPGPVLAVTIAAVIGGSMTWSVRWLRRREGVERRELVEATSWAFFVTVIGAASYGLLESLADAPRLSMWAVWGGGMAAWAIIAFVRPIWSR